MDKNRPNRRRELMVLLGVAVIIAVITIGFVTIDTTDQTAPDIVTDTQRAVDSETMAPEGQ